MNLIFIVLQYARGIIHTPTYWDHANFAEDLYPLMKYTLICNYNPNKIPVKLASSGKDKNVEFDFIADQLMSDKYSITKNMGMIPKQYYDHTEAELTKVPEVDRDLAVFYLRDQSVYFNDVFVVGHFHEFLKDMKMLDAIQLYNKMRDISKGGVDSVIAYQVLEKIVGYKPEYIEFESLGLHPFRATWEEIEKAREDSINKPLEAGLNPLRRTKKKWEIDEEKVDYQVIDGVLDLSQKNLKEIPEEIFDLVEITKLDLSDNQLTSLPSAICDGSANGVGGIGKLVNLKKLSVSNNRLTSLPSEMGQLINLKQFAFDHNPLEYIPPEVRELFNQMGIDVPF